MAGVCLVFYEEFWWLLGLWLLVIVCTEGTLFWGVGVIFVYLEVGFFVRG